MKFTFKPSPNYRQENSTSQIMKDLTLCLLAVLTFATIWYGVTKGFQYGLRVVSMAVFACTAAILTEMIWFKAAHKPWTEVFHSYGWVTALIIVLITRINVSYYAVIVSTVVAIVFGKLVFGGFGQNIFNPAAFGEAIIMNAFGASTAMDITTGATPMTTANSQGWIFSGSALDSMLSQFNGFGGMLTGNYESVIGASCTLLILLCFVYLVWRKDIDWRTSVTYMVTIFVLSLIVGLIKGAGFNYAVFNLLGGGVIFGAVFMMTDPVTSPVTIPGRIVFGIGAAALTLIIRWRSSLPDGVLFSILLMNMLTPAIDKAFSGSQIKDAAKFTKRVCIIGIICAALAIFVGCLLQPKEASTAAVQSEDIAYVEETSNDDVSQL